MVSLGLWIERERLITVRQVGYSRSRMLWRNWQMGRDDGLIFDTKFRVHSQGERPGDRVGQSFSLKLASCFLNTAF